MLTVLAIVSLTTAVAWELRIRTRSSIAAAQGPQFRAGCLVIYAVFLVLYGSNVLMPQMVQALFGYDAYTAGLIMSPAGIAVMICMPISGFLFGRRFDARYLIFFGVLCIAAGSYWAALMNFEVSPWVLVVRRSANWWEWVSFLPRSTRPPTSISRGTKPATRPASST